MWDKDAARSEENTITNAKNALFNNENLEVFTIK